jgi:Domain of unknown function (DUF4287)
MTRHKDLKKLVRARMRKTGESYTSARAQLARRKSREAAPARVPLAERAGMKDDAVRAATGRTWAQWLRTLDAVDAAAKPHRDIARHLREAHDLPGWWAQAVTVGYERIRGLRRVGQRRSGAWEVSKSRTVPVGVDELYRSFADGRVRRRWLPGAAWKVRAATTGRSMRVEHADGTRFEARFASKTAGKSTVTIEHGGLAGREAAEESKRFWHERLTALAGMLSDSR